jgi:hypothetical protein
MIISVVVISSTYADSLIKMKSLFGENIILSKMRKISEYDGDKGT